LIKALKDGAFSKTGEKLTDEDMRRLRHSKKWNERHMSFLRKIILPGPTQKHQLHNWIEEFKDGVDIAGRPPFTRNAEKIATEQLKKAHHASDVPGVSMCQETSPGPRSTHGLSKWKCKRPESPLEAFHAFLANCGDTGMQCELADTVTLGGSMEFNVKMRWKHSMNNKKLAGETVDVPGDFIDSPRFYDHSFLHHLNQLALEKGFPPMFKDVHLIGENNGEVFLSQHFKEQMLRNDEVGQDDKSMCKCPTCIAQIAAQTTLFARENNQDNDTNDNDTNDNHNTNDEDMPDSPVPVAPAAPRLFIQPSSMSASFVAPIPLAQLACGHWIQPRPQSCCYVVGNCHHCSSHAEHLRQKHSGKQVLGKPPHDKDCPVRRHLRR
jgi:hypothetical protein